MLECVFGRAFAKLILNEIGVIKLILVKIDFQVK